MDDELVGQTPPFAPTRSAGVVMWPFHRHAWEVRVRTYSPPHPNFTADRMSEHMAERIYMGITTVLLTCPCGAVRREELIGAEVQK